MSKTNIVTYIAVPVIFFLGFGTYYIMTKPNGPALLPVTSVTVYIDSELIKAAPNLKEKIAAGIKNSEITTELISADISLSIASIHEGDLAFGKKAIGSPVAPLSGSEIVTRTEAPLGYIHINNPEKNKKQWRAT